MVELSGFSQSEETLVGQLIGRFTEEGFRLTGLSKVEKADRPGYDGVVIPRLAGKDLEEIEMDMMVSSCNPFTIAHELAHVSDIATRQADSRANIHHAMPAQWHLAYKMSSEYYANRVACGFAHGDDIFRAFKSDAAGMLGAAMRKDWGNFLIYYSLMLGILHGIDRMDCEPLRMFVPKSAIPVRVVKGMAGFKKQSVDFFDGYGATQFA